MQVSTLYTTPLAIGIGHVNDYTLIRFEIRIVAADEPRVIDVWCGLEQSTINMAIDH